MEFLKECSEDEADKVVITVLHSVPETDENVCVHFDELGDLFRSTTSMVDGEDFVSRAMAAITDPLLSDVAGGIYFNKY